MLVCGGAEGEGELVARTLISLLGDAAQVIEEINKNNASHKPAHKQKASFCLL
jgi:hypothetical protein